VVAHFKPQGGRGLGRIARTLTPQNRRGTGVKTLNGGVDPKVGQSNSSSLERAVTPVVEDRTECHAPNNEDDQEEEVRPHSEQCETKTSSAVTKDCTAHSRDFLFSMKQLETMKRTKTRKVNSWQKPNIGTKHPGKPNSLVKSQHKLEMARRRSRVAELASEGKSVRAAEDILRSEGFTHCDHVTVAADLKLEYQRLDEAAKATREKHRQRVLAKLMLLEDRVRTRGYDDPNYVSDLLSIIDRVIKLLGLSQERHQVNVAVATNDGIPPEKLIGWRRWLHETRHVPEPALEEIYQLCRKLSQPPTAETTAALMIPPADSPLWHDDEDEDEKGEGEPN
jgi:hypothetical protein